MLASLTTITVMHLYNGMHCVWRIISLNSIIIVAKYPKVVQNQQEQVKDCMEFNE